MVSDKCLYIGGLANQASEREIKEYFSKVGNVVSINVKGHFGFIEYDSINEAKDAEHQLHNTEFMGKRLTVEFAKGPKRERKPAATRPGRSSRSSYRLIVENISSSTTWQALKDYFRKGGEVVFTDVRKDRSKPYGIVEFKSYDDMKRALRKLDDTDLDGKRILLKEDYVESRRDERRRDRYSPYGRRSYSPRRRSRSRSPRRSSRSPRRRSPRRERSRSPRKYNSKSRRRSDSRSPVRRSSRSPRKNRSPVAQRNRSRSPRGNSHSPRPRSKSPPQNDKPKNSSPGVQQQQQQHHQDDKARSRSPSPKNGGRRSSRSHSK